MYENEYTEFKKTTGELSDAMISISAILNKHEGGVLYFGLINDGTPSRFDIKDSTLRDVSRKISESIRPQIFPAVELVTIGDASVIKVTFSGSEVPYSAFGKYYIRTADEDRELSPSELRKIMIGKEYEDNWEHRSSNETADDVDEETLRKFYQAATECGRLPEAGLDKISLLKKLGLMNGEHLTNAGKYLFSSNHPIVLKMAIFATDQKVTFLDIVREEGNIFQLIARAIRYIIDNMRWRVRLSKDGIHREEIPEVPVDAIREAVVNSFAHARYDINVQHEIDIFSNRISIVNPGTFANNFTPEDFSVHDLHSFLRNETIAKTLYLCKDVEVFGSGLRKIYTLCRNAGVTISYNNEESFFSLEFSRVDRNLIPLDYAADSMKRADLSQLDKDIMIWLKNDPHLTVIELSEKSKKSPRTIARALASLKSMRLIERVGSNKTGYWRVVESAV